MPMTCFFSLYDVRTRGFKAINSNYARRRHRPINAIPPSRLPLPYVDWEMEKAAMLNRRTGKNLIRPSLRTQILQFFTAFQTNTLRDPSERHTTFFSDTNRKDGTIHPPITHLQDHLYTPRSSPLETTRLLTRHDGCCLSSLTSVVTLPTGLKVRICSRQMPSFSVSHHFLSGTDEVLIFARHHFF